MTNVRVRVRVRFRVRVRATIAIFVLLHNVIAVSANNQKQLFRE